MSRVQGENTSPEIAIRKLLHSLGYRFRLHRRDLPGKPDIVLPKYHSVIFIHGCFWHGHKNCQRSARPTTNVAFWYKKLDTNMLRDRQVRASLQGLGWKVLVIWECQVRSRSLADRLKRFLAPIPVQGDSR
jgi:DNA mismatch endonuclease (patch repair protein)